MLEEYSRLVVEFVFKFKVDDLVVVNRERTALLRFALDQLVCLVDDLLNVGVR